MRFFCPSFASLNEANKIALSCYVTSLTFGSFKLPIWKPLGFPFESSFLVVLVLSDSQTAFGHQQGGDDDKSLITKSRAWDISGIFSSIQAVGSRAE